MATGIVTRLKDRFVDANSWVVGLVSGLRQRLKHADISTSAAAVAYNAFLAVVPLTTALLGVASLVGKNADTVARVRESLEPVAPETVTDFVVDLLRDANRQVGGGEFLLIAGSIVVALFLGSRAVVAMQRALAAVENKTERRKAVAMRLVAIGLTIGAGVALILTSFLLLSGRRAIEFLADWTGLGFLDTLWASLRVPLSALGMFLFLLAFYQWGPPEPLPKSWLAAVVATVLVVLASIAFGLYLSLSPNLGATFGTLGAVAIALVWLYIGAFGVLLGAVVVAYTLRWRSERHDRLAPAADG